MLEELERLIRRKPGLTATQLAHALFGDDGYHERVGAACRTLSFSGRVERRGSGGPGDPYTYHPTGSLQRSADAPALRRDAN